MLLFSIYRSRKMLNNVYKRPRWGKKTAGRFCFPTKKAFVSRARQRVASTGKLRDLGDLWIFSFSVPQRSPGNSYQTPRCEKLHLHLHWRGSAQRGICERARAREGGSSGDSCTQARAEINSRNGAPKHSLCEYIFGL